MHRGPMLRRRRMVLASGSRYRSDLALQLCEALEVEFEARAALVDERAVEAGAGPCDPRDLARLLARTKARTVCEDLGGEHDSLVRERIDTIVIGGDQLLVTAAAGEAPALLHQPETVERAVEQLCSLSGTTHHLINGLCAIRLADGSEAATIDVYRITMREFSRSEAADYVERFLPLDCVGAYRIEDDADLISSLDGEDHSGVIGFPFPAVGRMLGELGWHDGPSAATGLSQSVK